MTKRNDIINANHICDICKENNIRWYIPRNLIGIYIYKNEKEYRYFPLWKVLEAYSFIDEIIETTRVERQSSLDEWDCDN